jgi:hypothetical protein
MEEGIDTMLEWEENIIRGAAVDLERSFSI